MSEFSRRDLLRSTALSVVFGALDVEAAQHVHKAVEEERTGGIYTPKAFTPHEYKTLNRLTDLIVPADGSSPGALASGAAAWIDLLASQNAELAAIYTGGIAWLDHAIQNRGAKDFVSASEQQQTALLDLIAYRKNDSPELGPGIGFFAWVRKMTVDAFYTSKFGAKEVGYRGNTAVAKFEIPTEAIEYALTRFPGA